MERDLEALSSEGSADAGYSSYDSLECAEEKKLDMYMPDDFLEALDQKEENGGRYHKINFHYDEVRDKYICLEGNELEQWGEHKREGKPSLILYRGESCRECAVTE